MPALERNAVPPPPLVRLKLPWMVLLPARLMTAPCPAAVPPLASKLVVKLSAAGRVMLPPLPSSWRDGLLPGLVTGMIVIVLAVFPRALLLLMTTAPLATVTRR